MPTRISADFAPTFYALLSICHGASHVYAPDPVDHPTVFSVGARRDFMQRANQLLARELCAWLPTTGRDCSLRIGGLAIDSAFADLQMGVSVPGGAERAAFYRQASEGRYHGVCSVPQVPGSLDDYLSVLAGVTSDAAQLFADVHASAAADVGLDPALADDARRASAQYGAIP